MARLVRVQELVSGDGFDRSRQVESAVQAEPFACVTMPVDIEAIAGDPVQACEGSVELFASVLWEAGTVALNKAIPGAMPFAENVDGIVELRGSDAGQVTRLEDLVDQPLASDRDSALLS